MARYIDAEPIVKNLKSKIINPQTSFINTVLIGLLDKAPTADVVEVVRCAKCKHWEKTDTDIILNIDYGKCTNCESPCHNEEETTGGNYCSYGERRCE